MKSKVNPPSRFHCTCDVGRLDSLKGHDHNTWKINFLNVTVFWDGFSPPAGSPTTYLPRQSDIRHHLPTFHHCGFLSWPLILTQSCAKRTYPSYSCNMPRCAEYTDHTSMNHINGSDCQHFIFQFSFLHIWICFVAIYFATHHVTIINILLFRFQPFKTCRFRENFNYARVSPHISHFHRFLSPAPLPRGFTLKNNVQDRIVSPVRRVMRMYEMHWFAHELRDLMECTASHLNCAWHSGTHWIA